MRRSLGAGLAILAAWTLIDVLMHRLFLAPFYEASPSLWRPFDQMSVALIYAVTLVLVGVFVGTYSLLVRPKSLGAGLSLGAFVGLALGISSGFGTFIHMPIPMPLALGLVDRWMAEGARGRRDRWCSGQRSNSRRGLTRAWSGRRWNPMTQSAASPAAAHAQGVPQGRTVLDEQHDVRDQS
jgi:hypothetical protein